MSWSFNRVSIPFWYKKVQKGNNPRDRGPDTPGEITVPGAQVGNHYYKVSTKKEWARDWISGKEIKYQGLQIQVKRLICNAQFLSILNISSLVTWSSHLQICLTYPLLYWTETGLNSWKCPTEKSISCNGMLLTWFGWVFYKFFLQSFIMIKSLIWTSTLPLLARVAISVGSEILWKHSCDS